MNKLLCVENYIDQNQNHHGCFLIEPLETGQGITLGNAIRRTLLSNLSGFAVTGARINNLAHEFETIDGLREDVLEVLLNLKELNIKGSHFYSPTKTSEKIKGFLNIQGPIIVTAGMFKLPKDAVKIMNPSQYICTLVDDSELYLEIDIENGKGCRLTEESAKATFYKKVSPISAATLRMDAIFAPVKKAQYKVKLIHDTQGNIKESLQIEILTNGTITPKRSLQESIKILMGLISPLFLDHNFFLASSELAKKFYKTT